VFYVSVFFDLLKLLPCIHFFAVQIVSHDVTQSLYACYTLLCVHGGVLSGATENARPDIARLDNAAPD